MGLFTSVCLHVAVFLGGRQPASSAIAAQQWNYDLIFGALLCNNENL
jgi:hypothetical protein